MDEWIIKILYIRYINICTVHKKNGKQFIITNVFEEPPTNEGVMDFRLFYIMSVYIFAVKCVDGCTIYP